MTIKTMYYSPTSAVQLNGRLTDWFSVRSGVRQGDSLSPTLFALFINDLATEIKEAKLGVDVDDTNISILLYADDIALISPTYRNSQLMLDILSKWCAKWCMKVQKIAICPCP